jgi:hypothetical protein
MPQFRDAQLPHHVLMILHCRPVRLRLAEGCLCPARRQEQQSFRKAEERFHLVAVQLSEFGALVKWKKRSIAWRIL